MLVLALDTSTPVMTAGLVRVDENGRSDLLGERTFTGAFSHAEQLMPLVEEVLTAAAASLQDLRAVVVGLGPGPFTGLRVGIASAAALGDALQIPVHGVPSHDGLARTVVTGEPFLVVTDARRREVYLSGYDGAGTRVLGPEPVAPAAVRAAAAALNPAFVTGPGVDLLAGSFPDGTGMPSRPAAGALSIGLVAAVPSFEASPAPLVPLYLRRPDATEPGAKKSVLGR